MISISPSPATLALDLEEGGELLRPLAAAAIGQQPVNVLVALPPVPVLHAWLTPRGVPAPRSARLRAGRMHNPNDKDATTTRRAWMYTVHPYFSFLVGAPPSARCRARR